MTKVLINDAVYELAAVEGAYAVEEIGGDFPPLHEGVGALVPPNRNSSVDWLTWHLGFGAAIYLPGRYSYTEDVDCRWKNMAILSGKKQTTGTWPGTITKFSAQIGSWLYALCGRYVARTDGTSIVTVYDTGDAAIVATDIVEMNGNIYVTLGATTAYIYSATGASGSWTSSTRAGNDKYGTYLLVLRDSAAARPILWKGTKPNELQSTTSGINGGAAWSAIVYAGTSGTSITGMAQYRDGMVVKKSDGTIRSYDASGAETIRYGGNGDPDSVDAVMTEWVGTGMLYARSGMVLRALAESGTATVALGPQRFIAAGPEILSSPATGVYGQIVGLLPTERWLWGVLKTTAATPTYYLVCYGEVDQIEGQPVYAWHTLNNLGTSAAGPLGWYRPSAANPRLYYASGAGAGYVIQPDGVDNPVLDPNYQFGDNGALYFSSHYGQTVASKKRGVNVYPLVTNVDASVGRAVDISVALDGGSFVSLGRAGDETPLAFSQTEAQNTFRRIQYWAHLRTNAVTTTPRLNGLGHEYRPLPNPQLLHRMALRGDEGAERLKSVMGTLTTLRGDMSLVTLVEPLGLTWNGFIAGLPRRTLRQVRDDSVSVIEVQFESFTPSSIERTYWNEFDWEGANWV